MGRDRLAVVVSSEMTIKAFLLGHLRAWSEHADVTVFANTMDTQILARSQVPGQIQSVAIERQIRPLADARALLSLAYKLWRGRFRAVVSITPKAGLLAMLAAFIVRVPVRVHIFTGQVWATRTGLARVGLKCLDGLMARLATHVLVDGEPQRQFLIEEGVVTLTKASVLAEGSLCGVDVQRFRPDAKVRRSVRAELELPDAALVFLYLGRFNRDKGVLDLAEAFAQLAESVPGACLLMVGPDEAGMLPLLQQRLFACLDRVRFLPFSAEPESLMAAADIFVLPSYREGFPTSVLEAAACGLPTIGARVYGTQGALVEGQGGLMFVPGDVADLFSCMQRLVDSPALCRELGECARQRASQSFAATHVIAAFSQYLVGVMGGRQ